MLFAIWQAQPKGPGPFSRLTALSLVYLTLLNCTPSALLSNPIINKNMGLSAAMIKIVLTGPK
jgi:hypothetical protein